MKTDRLFQFVDVERALSFQQEMAKRVIAVDDADFRPRLVCGVDVAYDRNRAYVAATVWDMDLNRLVESVCTRGETSVYYVPGLFGFREGPLLVGVSRKLRCVPDVFMVDGHGIAHPRSFGLACQFGLAIDRPTIGVAKSLLYGQPCQDSIVDPTGHVIARVLTTALGKRFYVSVGHRISLETAIRLVESCILDGHLVPLRQAHIDSGNARREVRV